MEKKLIELLRAMEELKKKGFYVSFNFTTMDNLFVSTELNGNRKNYYFYFDLDEDAEENFNNFIKEAIAC